MISRTLGRRSNLPPQGRKEVKRYGGNLERYTYMFDSEGEDLCMAEIKNLEIDIESFSDVDLAKCGVYKYASAPDFEVILFAYSVDGGPVRQVDLASGEKIPAEIIAALEDNTVIKWAFNANFERICLSRYLGYPTGDYLMPDSWRCSMVWAAYLGLPLSLEGVGTVLGLEKQKLTEGKNLIN